MTIYFSVVKSNWGKSSENSTITNCTVILLEKIELDPAQSNSILLLFFFLFFYDYYVIYYLVITHFLQFRKLTFPKVKFAQRKF